MPAPPRILFVAAPDAAVAALDAVRQGGPVEGRLAPTADILKATLARGTESWDAVVFVPGGPVEAVEVAAYVPEGLPLVIVAEHVPPLMHGTSAQALPLDQLAYLATGLAAPDPVAALSDTNPGSDLEAAPPGPDPALEAAPPAPESTSALEAETAPDTPGPFGHGPLASLADHLPIGLYRSTPDGRFLYANPALAPILGVASPEDLIDVSASDIGYPQDAFVEAMKEKGSIQNLVLSWTRRTGERIHTRESARAVCDDTGTVLYHEGTLEDVTAEVEAMRDLRDAETSLSVVAEHAPHVLYRLRYTPEGSSFVFLSPSIETLTGYRRDEIDARGGFTALVDRRDVLEGAGLTEGPVAGAERLLAVYRMQTAHGERWVENTGRPWRSESGRVLGLVGVLQDVTDRKHREDQVTDAAQAALIRQRALVDLAQLEGPDSYGAPAAAIAAATLGADSVSIWRTSKDGGLRALHAPAGLDDAAAASALEGALSTISTQRALAISDLEADDRVDELGLRPFVDAFSLRAFLIAPVRRGNHVGGVVVIHRSQAYDWDAADAEFTAAAADAVALGIERCERSRAVAALHESERRHRVLAEMASDYAFATRERDGRTESVVWTAGACLRLTGQEIDGPDGVETLRSLLLPSSQATVRMLSERWRTSGQADGQFQVVTQDGRRRWVHHRARRGDTEPDGSVVVYHSGRDVTLQKTHEAALVDAREAAEEGQAAAERMNRLKSGFLANMSHEIRTPLTGILGFSDLLESELEGDHAEFVGHITRNGNRLLRTLSNVLDLSRLDAGEYGADLQPSRLAPILREATTAHVLEADALGLRFDLEVNDRISAAVDSVVLSRAIGHIADNALKFTESGGVMVTLEAAEGPEGQPAAAIRVADTGCGISPAFLGDLFDEFRQQDTGYTRTHEGSGLGLALTKRLMDLLDGHVQIHSEQPGGTVVTLLLPLLEMPIRTEPSLDSPALGAADPEPFRPIPEGDLSIPLEVSTGTADPLEGEAKQSPASKVLPLALEVDPPALEAEIDVPEAPVLQTAPSAAEVSPADPFDFAFLTAPPPDTVPTVPANPPDDMFSFRRARPDPEAPDASASKPASPTETPPTASTPTPANVPPVPARPPAPPAPVYTPPAAPAPAASVPSVPAPAFQESAPAFQSVSAPVAEPPPAPTQEEPVFLVRARPDNGPTIPEATVTEDAELVEDETDSRPSVLVVEDNDDTRMLLERILRSTYKVTAVADARSALQAMNQTRFGGLVLDINLGGKETGADVLRIARALPDYSTVFAIALTAYALPGDRERLLEAGFNEYVSKPFTRQALMETLAAGVSA